MTTPSYADALPSNAAERGGNRLATALNSQVVYVGTNRSRTSKCGEMGSPTLDDLSRALGVPQVARKLNRDRATIYSWTKEGIRGVRLKTLLVGGRRFVLPEYVEEFVAALSAGSDFSADEHDRAAAVEVAESELDALLG